MGQDEDNKAAHLPDDLLVDILRRLAPCWLAVSRSVCKAWQTTVDARRLLRTDVLPLRLGGIFMYFSFHKFPEFFSRPWTPITGKMDFLPCVDDDPDNHLCELQDHCNGLLLLQEATGAPSFVYVANPATRRWDSLPNSPPIHVMGVEFSSNMFLAFDPMVSPHYEVFMIPHIPWMRDGEHLDPSLEESEWPPATFIINVFSSRTHCWEPKSFRREGDALGTIAQMQARKEHTSSWSWQRRRAVYRRAALYVHCDKGFLMSISLLNGTFHAIELPEAATSTEYEYAKKHLGRSEKGVYFASIYDGRLRVSILDESCGEMKWMLKQEHYLVLPCHKFEQRGPWVLQDTNYNFFHNPTPYKYRIKGAISDEEGFEWSSDDEAISDEDEFKWGSDDDRGAVANRDKAEMHRYRGDITILGFHPFKEIIFLLLVGSKTPLAYIYNSFKAEVLGEVKPTDYENQYLLPNEARTIEGFPYVPCWLEEIPTNT